MPTIPLRNDFDAERVRVLAARSDDGNQARRLLSMAAIYDGMDRACAAGIGGMDRQTLRDWVHRFNAGGPAGLIDRKPNGALRRLTPSQMAALSRAIEAGSRSRTGWGRALALHRSQATDPNALRRGLSRAERRQAAGRARVLAYFRAPAPRRPGCAGTGGI